MCERRESVYVRSHVCACESMWVGVCERAFVCVGYMREITCVCVREEKVFVYVRCHVCVCACKSMC